MVGIPSEAANAAQEVIKAGAFAQTALGIQVENHVRFFDGKPGCFHLLAILEASGDPDKLPQGWIVWVPGFEDVEDSFNAVTGDQLGLAVGHLLKQSLTQAFPTRPMVRVLRNDRRPNLGRQGVALLFQPVGEDEPERVIGRIGLDGVEERIKLAH
jgi:hypothetical protein